MIQMQLWFLVKLRRKNNSHEWMKLVAQCLKVTKIEDEDGGGGCGGGDGSNDSGCDNSPVELAPEIVEPGKNW